MIKILHVIDTGGPGGAETVFRDLATLIEPDSYQHIAVVGRVDWLHGQLSARGIKTHAISASGRFNIRYLYTLIKLIRRYRPSIIISHLLGSNTYCSLASLLTGVPVICIFHGPTDVPDGTVLTKIKLSLINKLASRLVFVSRALESEVAQKYSFQESNVQVIHNGVQAMETRSKKLSNLKWQLGVSDNSVIVGSIGNLRPAKNYGLLVMVAQRLLNEKQDYHFVVYGHQRADLFAELSEMCSELGVADRVHWMGFCDNPREALENFDIYAITSNSEGVPLSCLETMMAGVPIVSTICGGLPEVLTHNETGLLVPTNDVQAFAEAVVRLSSDVELRDDVIRNSGRKVRNEFGVDSMVQKYASLVRSVIANQ